MTITHEERNWRLAALTEEVRERLLAPNVRGTPTPNLSKRPHLSL